jgi:hypothetical protein
MMRTDDLIEALARDPVPALPSVPRLLLRAFALGLPVSLVLFAATIGVRKDLLPALAEGWFGIKLLLVGLIAVAGWQLTGSRSRPGGSVPLTGVLAAGLAMLTAIALDLRIEGVADWSERLIGDNAVKCMLLIPLLSLAPLAGLLHALQDAAPVRPGEAGAAAGLLAGALGALLYGLHCTDDSPLFLGVWYLASIGLMMLVGAFAGRKLLRW